MIVLVHVGRCCKTLAWVTGGHGLAVEEYLGFLQALDEELGEIEAFELRLNFLHFDCWAGERSRKGFVADCPDDTGKKEPWTSPVAGQRVKGRSRSVV